MRHAVCRSKAEGEFGTRRNLAALIEDTGTFARLLFSVALHLLGVLCLPCFDFRQEVGRYATDHFRLIGASASHDKGKAEEDRGEANTVKFLCHFGLSGYGGFGKRSGLSWLGGGKTKPSCNKSHCTR